MNVPTMLWPSVGPLCIYLDLHQPKLFLKCALFNSLLRSHACHSFIYLQQYFTNLFFEVLEWDILSGEGEADLEDPVQSFNICGSPSPDGLLSVL